MGMIPGTFIVKEEPTTVPAAVEPRAVLEAATSLRAAGRVLEVLQGFLPGVAAALLLALSPRLRGLTWLPVGWALVVGLLGEALQLPRWGRDLSPFELVGRVPVEGLNRTAWVWLAVAAVGACAAATARFGSRSLARG